MSIRSIGQYPTSFRSRSFSRMIVVALDVAADAPRSWRSATRFPALGSLPHDEDRALPPNAGSVSLSPPSRAALLDAQSDALEWFARRETAPVSAHRPNRGV